MTWKVIELINQCTWSSKTYKLLNNIGKWIEGEAHLSSYNFGIYVYNTHEPKVLGYRALPLSSLWARNSWIWQIMFVDENFNMSLTMILDRDILFVTEYSCGMGRLVAARGSEVSYIPKHWHPRWCWMMALRKLQTKKLLKGINQIQILPHINSMASSQLGA